MVQAKDFISAKTIGTALVLAALFCCLISLA